MLPLPAATSRSGGCNSGNGRNLLLLLCFDLVQRAADRWARSVIV